MPTTARSEPGQNQEPGTPSGSLTTVAGAQTFGLHAMPAQMH